MYPVMETGVAVQTAEGDLMSMVATLQVTLHVETVELELVMEYYFYWYQQAVGWMRTS